MTPLNQKSALITGGGTGIGKAIALDLANAGVEVTICGRRSAPLEETVNQITNAGGKARYLMADMAEPESIEALAKKVLEQGGVDILVNNAGFSSKVRNARHIGAEEWRAVMDVNTLGPAMLTRHLLDPMIEKGYGDVVLIASMAAVRPSLVAGPAYTAAKTAAKAYMDFLQQELKPYGIRCLTVCPGEVETPILDNRARVPDEKDRATMIQPEDVSAAVIMALSLPQRTSVTDIVIATTFQRDMTTDIEAARNSRST
jgi:NAD(P)-dependent dehydrogenase (short-subunit alcohol dehydrogenase family)